jgi:hypothetical protein
MIRVHPGAAGGQRSYEAESSANTLSGGARVASCSGCAGGAKVGFVGMGGVLRFNGVSAANAGTALMTIFYTDGDAGRSANVSVNGGSPFTVSFPGTGGWSTVGTLTVNVGLNAGANTIAYSNATAWAPDFDRIVV